jgi:predicted nucleic acid-binding protein
VRQFLFDTNVVLDVVLNREPWVASSYAIWQAHDHRHLVGFVSASTITDVFYVARRIAGIDQAFRAVRLCLETFEICTVDRKTLEKAERLPGNDFEDRLQIACAIIAELDAIVTRDVEGFSDSPVPVLSPTEALEKLHSDTHYSG